MEFKEMLEWIINDICEKEELTKTLRPNLEKIDDEELKSYISFEVEEWMYNRRGEVQGGVIAAMFDIAMGATANACLGEGKMVTTAGVNVSYVRPLHKGKYTFISEISNVGKTLIRVYSKAIDVETKAVMALCSGDFVPFKDKKEEV